MPVFLKQTLPRLVNVICERPLGSSNELDLGKEFSKRALNRRYKNFLCKLSQNDLGFSSKDFQGVA